MAERGVENFARAEVLAPRDGVVARLLAVRMLFEHEQFVDGLGVVVLDDINLVVDLESVAEVLGRGMALVLVDGLDRDLRAVGLEFTAQHFEIGLEAVESVAARVHGDERAAALHPVDKALAVGQGQVARGVGEDDRVILLQICRAEFGEARLERCVVARLRGFDLGFAGLPLFQVGLILHLRGFKLGHLGLVFGLRFFIRVPGKVFGLLRGVGFLRHLAGGLLDIVHHGEGPAFLAQSGDGLLRRGDGAVAEAGGDADHQHLLRRGGGAQGK